MRKALIFSDSHGNIDRLLEIVKKHSDVNEIFHLGDIEKDEDRLRNSLPCSVYIVRGNCDYSASLKENLLFDYYGKKVAMTHGHRYLSYGMETGLRYWGLQNEADILMFGHTHIPYLASEENKGKIDLEFGKKYEFEKKSGMIMLNPGSISKPRQAGHIPTYALMEIDEGIIRICFEYGA